MRRSLDHGYAIDDDPSSVDVDAVAAFLSTHAYWGRWRSRENIEQQIASAWRVVAAYDGTGATVGFARAVSDGVALAYLADVYVHDAHRGHGLGVAIVEHMLAAGPDFRWMLHTRDAHELYRRFGFRAPAEDFMELPHVTAR